MSKEIEELKASLGIGEAAKTAEDNANALTAASHKALATKLTATEAKQAELEDLVKAMEAKLASKSNLSAPAPSAFNILSDAERVKEIETLVLLSKVMDKKSVFDTQRGQAHLKAVNASSSVQVSSEGYETIFNQNILRDIQAKLVLGNLFPEIPLNSKSLTMMITPKATAATWVDASNYGKVGSTGAELKTTLTEVTFKAFKLASKSFITDETDEDAIVPMLAIVREQLIESHVKAIEGAFLAGNGTANAPTGLIKLADDASKKVATIAADDGSVKVTAKMLHSLRSKLGEHGLDTTKLAAVVSMDAYYDLLQDDEWQDVNQVGMDSAVKLQGQIGKIYGMPVMVSQEFPAKASGKEFCALVNLECFVMPRQRTLTIETARDAEMQRDAIYVTQRINLQANFAGEGVVTGTYA